MLPLRDRCFSSHACFVSFASVAVVHIVSNSHSQHQPVFDIESHLVFVTSRHNVTDVWVGGQQLLRNRELLTLKHDEVLSRSKNWRTAIHSHREKHVAALKKKG